MIGSWEIDSLDNPDAFHDLALAYLDISIIAERQIVYGSFFPRFSHSRAVLSMAYHGTELFLKGAILRATSGKKCSGHDLGELYDEYRGLYPEKSFHFSLPFSVSYLGFTAEQISKLKEKEPPQDQMYRYHTDREGGRWEGIHGFDANSFLHTLESLRKKLIELGHLIHRKPDKGRHLNQGDGE